MSSSDLNAQQQAIHQGSRLIHWLHYEKPGDPPSLAYFYGNGVVMVIDEQGERRWAYYDQPVDWYSNRKRISKTYLKWHKASDVLPAIRRP